MSSVFSLCSPCVLLVEYTCKYCVNMGVNSVGMCVALHATLGEVQNKNKEPPIPNDLHCNFNFNFQFNNLSSLFCLLAISISALRSKGSREIEM